VLTAYLMDGFQPFASQPWRPTMIVYGLVGLLVAACFWIVVRDQPQDHPACNAAELELIHQGRPATTPQPPGPAGRLPLLAMPTTSRLWFSSISQFGTNLGWGFLVFMLPRYLADAHQVPIVERGWMTGTPIAVGLFGMLAGGWLTDRLTRAWGLRWGRSLPI